MSPCFHNWTRAAMQIGLKMEDGFTQEAQVCRKCHARRWVKLDGEGNIVEQAARAQLTDVDPKEVTG